MSRSADLPGWHWPSFPKGLCGNLTDRERLGLPECYVAGPLEGELARAYAQSAGASRESLGDILASPSSSLAARIAAGNQLALAGDPRIATIAPEMKEIPGGEARLGLPESQVGKVLATFVGLGLERSWIEKECPDHIVSIRRFRLARFPVTNAEYRDFLIDTGHPEIPTSWHFRRFPQERSNHPVYTVSPAAADAYAAWLARSTGRAFRLPTESEWEWAAAGPEGREFPWGGQFDPALANTAETGLFSTSPVGAFLGGESPFGNCDMAGNVEEYVADGYSPYPGGTYVADHLTRIDAGYRVARGGGFARFRDLARTRRRHGWNPASGTYAMGFRLAESI